MAYFHTWPSLRGLFSKKRNWNFSTSYSNFFHVSFASIISRRKCDRPLNSYRTTANSQNQQANENSKGTLTWKLRERPETGDDGVKLQRQSLVEQCRHPHFSTSSEMFILQRHLVPGNDFYLFVLMRTTSYKRLSKGCLRIWSSVILQIISPL